PASPSTPAISTSSVRRPAGSPATFAVTTAVLPTNLFQSLPFRSGRSIPGDDTSSTYFWSPKFSASSLASIARDAAAQLSTVTFSPSSRSTLTSSTGRFLLPPTLSSKSSSPSGLISEATRLSSFSFMQLRGLSKGQKNVGGSPHSGWPPS